MSDARALRTAVLYLAQGDRQSASVLEQAGGWDLVDALLVTRQRETVMLEEGVPMVVIATTAAHGERIHGDRRRSVRPLRAPGSPCLMRGVGDLALWRADGPAARGGRPRREQTANALEDLARTSLRVIDQRLIEQSGGIGVVPIRANVKDMDAHSRACAVLDRASALGVVEALAGHRALQLVTLTPSDGGLATEEIASAAVRVHTTAPAPRTDPVAYSLVASDGTRQAVHVGEVPTRPAAPAHTTPGPGLLDHDGRPLA